MINIDEINRFFDRPFDLLDCKARIRNQFISFAIDVADLKMIKWIFEHSTELKINKKKFGKKIFHRAITGSSNGRRLERENNIDYSLLLWLHENLNIVDLFKKNKMIVFINIFIGNDISYKLLDWLFLNLPDLFKGIDDKGNTFFHYAALLPTPVVINWLYTHIPELFSYKDNQGKTAYDIAVDNGNLEVIKWITNNVPLYH